MSLIYTDNVLIIWRTLRDSKNIYMHVDKSLNLFYEGISFILLICSMMYMV